MADDNGSLFARHNRASMDREKVEEIEAAQPERENMIKLPSIATRKQMNINFDIQGPFDGNKAS